MKYVRLLFPLVVLSLLSVTFIQAQGTHSVKMVDVGGHKLEAVIAGKGSPVVVFEAGFTDDRTSWDAVFPMVAEFTTSVTYSRAGYSNSEPGPEPRSLEQINKELRALLNGLKLQPPYILVGHSLGGLFVRAYYNNYPDEVAGLVLVDSTHERQFNEWKALDPSWIPYPLTEEGKESIEQKEDASVSEAVTWLEVEREGVLPNTRPLDDLPVYILTADYPSPEDTSIANSEAGRQVWRNLHAELFKDVHHGAHIVTKRSNHQIQKSEPSLVVWAVDQAVMAVRQKLFSNQPSQRHSTPQDQYAEVNGVRLHYLDWGGDGPLMLLIPGLWTTAHAYDSMASSFTDKYRVLAVTRREHGTSSKNTGPISLDTLADDLSAFIDLFTTKPAVIVGQSFAGVEMPQLAKKYPEKVSALIFLDAVYDWPMWSSGDEPAFPATYNFPSDFESYGEVYKWFESAYPEMQGPTAAALLRSLTYLSNDRKVQWQLPWGPGPIASKFIESYPAWTSKEYSGVEVPVLSIQADFAGFFKNGLDYHQASQKEREVARVWAEYDSTAKRRGKKMLEKEIPHAVSEYFENTHHWLHIQRPKRVVQSIKSFLEKAGL